MNKARVELGNNEPAFYC